MEFVQKLTEVYPHLIVATVSGWTSETDTCTYIIRAQLEARKSPREYGSTITDVVNASH